MKASVTPGTVYNNCGTLGIRNFDIHSKFTIRCGQKSHMLDTGRWAGGSLLLRVRYQLTVVDERDSEFCA